MHNPRPWEIVGGRNERAKRTFAEEYAWRTRIREMEEERGGSANWKWKKDGEERNEKRIHLVPHRMHTCVTVFHDQEKSREMRSCDCSESWNQLLYPNFLYGWDMESFEFFIVRIVIESEI